MSNKQRINLNSTEFQPRCEYLLIKTEKPQQEKTTASGVIIPLGIQSGLQTRDTSGEVVQIGADISDVKIKDFVIWPETDGIDLEFIDGDFLLLRYKSVIGYKKRT